MPGLTNFCSVIAVVDRRQHRIQCHVIAKSLPEVRARLSLGVIRCMAPQCHHLGSMLREIVQNTAWRLGETPRECSATDNVELSGLWQRDECTTASPTAAGARVAQIGVRLVVTLTSARSAQNCRTRGLDWTLARVSSSDSNLSCGAQSARSGALASGPGRGACAGER